MNAACDIHYDRGTTERPAYVEKTFAGKCAVFPKPLPDGREPRFLSYQSAWIYDEHLAKIAEKSRQIGRFAEAMAAAESRRVPEWLELNRAAFEARVKMLPTRSQLTQPMKEQLIVELYSK